MKCKERTCTVHFPVFCNYKAHIVLTGDVVGARVARNKEIGEIYDNVEANAEGMHSWSVKPPFESWIFLRHIPNEGTVAHEAWHCMHRMFQLTGVGFDNETVAYHLGYLVDEIHTFVEKGQKHGVRKETKTRRGTQGRSSAPRKHGCPL